MSSPTENQMSSAAHIRGPLPTTAVLPQASQILSTSQATTPLSSSAPLRAAQTGSASNASTTHPASALTQALNPSTKRKRDDVQSSPSANAQDAGPVVKRFRFHKGPITIVLNGDPANLPVDVTFSFTGNRGFNILPSRPFRTTSSLNKRMIKQHKELIDLTIVDMDKKLWNFKYPDTHNADWDSEAWVESANIWLNGILQRCFDVEALPLEELATNDQWSSMEFSTLRTLVVTHIRRTRAPLTEKDWRLVAARFNLAFKGTTQLAGTVLASARGQPLSASKPFVVTRLDRVMKGRSAKSLAPVMNRFLDMRLSEWQVVLLAEAEGLGWLKDDEAADGERVVLSEGEEDEEETDEEDDSEGELVRRQQEIESEVKRLFTDPVVSATMATKSVVSVRAEYEKMLEKAKEKKRKVEEREEEVAEE